MDTFVALAQYFSTCFAYHSEIYALFVFGFIEKLSARFPIFLNWPVTIFCPLLLSQQMGYSWCWLEIDNLGDNQWPYLVFKSCPIDVRVPSCLYNIQYSIKYDDNPQVFLSLNPIITDKLSVLIFYNDWLICAVSLQFEIMLNWYFAHNSCGNQ